MGKDATYRGLRAASGQGLPCFTLHPLVSPVTPPAPTRGVGWGQRRYKIVGRLGSCKLKNGKWFEEHVYARLKYGMPEMTIEQIFVTRHNFKKKNLQAHLGKCITKGSGAPSFRKIPSFWQFWGFWAAAGFFTFLPGRHQYLRRTLSSLFTSVSCHIFNLLYVSIEFPYFKKWFLRRIIRAF